MSYEPLHHKYRPKTFAELVGQEAIATTLTNAIRSAKIATAYLFTGPRGTGKTSSARILAKSLNCLSSPVPTAEPCGVCDACQGISKGYAVDVIEIDAASNTGVDNIREIIERAQFAPVQCRYKVYVIDECLTGDALVITDAGLLRMDNPEIKGKKVLSYNDLTGNWEYKKVVRWLDQGIKQTLVIKTTSNTIRCTDNHLIRTEQGWIAAKDIKEGMRILSPANAVAEPSFINLVQMDVFGSLPQITNIEAITTDKKLTVLNRLLNWLKPFVPYVHVDVEKNLKSHFSYKKKVEAFKVLILTGSDIPIGKDTAFGTNVLNNLSQKIWSWVQRSWDLFTEPYLETVPSPIPTNTVATPAWLGHIHPNKWNGLSTKSPDYKCYEQKYGLQKIRDMVSSLSLAIQCVILNFEKYLLQLSLSKIENKYHENGLIKSLLRELLGGILMMVPSLLVPKAARKFNYIQKGSQEKKIKLSPIGLQKLGIRQKFVTIPEVKQVNNTTTLHSQLIPVENGCQTSNHTLHSQWNTNLELVEFVCQGGIENVYDIEVEDNHNFVANGLLVHNCHMLSTAAFNALLKTLEEPPKHVVFVLATTDPQRVLPTIISRCQRFDYRRIPLEAMIAHLRQIAINENIPIREDAIRLVAQLSQGGLRDAESLLDQLSLLSGEIVPESVWNLVGTVSERDLLNLVDAIATDNPQVTIESVRAILDRGREPLIILQSLAGFYRDLLIAKTAPDRPDLVACTEETWSAMVNYTQNFPVSALLQGQQHLRSAEVQLKNSTQPRLWLEVTLLGLLPSATVTNNTVAANPSPPVSQANFSPPPVEQAPTQPPPPAVHPPPSATVSTSPPTVEPPPQTIPPPVPPVEPPMGEESVAPVYDYGQIWQQVLMQIVPISRRELLRQMCQVVYMDDSSARVAIKSAWYKRVQEDLPVITSAFSAVLHRHIHVSLESANNFHSTNHLATENGSKSYQSLPKNISSVQSSTTTVKLPTHSFVNHPQVQNHSSQPHPNPNPQVQNYQHQNHSSQSHPNPNSQVQNYQHQNHPNQPVQTNNYQTPRPTVPGVSPPTQTPIPKKTEAENKQPYNPPVEIQETPKNPVISSPVSSVEVEAILNAAKKLAEFFDGKIVTDQDSSDFDVIDGGIEFREELDSGDD